MLGRIGISCLLVLCCSGCGLATSTQNTTTPIDKSPAHHSTESFNMSPFSKKPAHDLLSQSITLDYPDDITFTPTFLGDNGLIYGYGHDAHSPQRVGLYELNPHTNHYTLLKQTDDTSSTSTIGAYYADDDVVFFHEYYYEDTLACYYILNKHTQELTTLLTVNNTPPLHYTDVARLNDTLYVNIANEDGTYPIYEYQLSTGQLTLVEKANSGFPTIANQKLYYLRLNNDTLVSQVMVYDPHSQEKNSLMSSGPDTDMFYSGLFSNGSDFLLHEQTHQSITITQGDLHTMTPVFTTRPTDLPVYEHHYFTFIAHPDKDSEGRMKNYLYDMDRHIEYIYSDSSLYLSKAGILWVELLTNKDSIEQGQIFTKDHSVMRFLEF